jgi:SAM-dependent methyltransferase
LSDEPRRIVAEGYDAVSRLYRGDDDIPAHYREWIAELEARLRPAATVLDLGCGCGVPVARELTAAGHAVTGVDLSPVQIERARRLVPQGDFHVADLSEVTFEPALFDAVVCLYSIIHLPLDEHARLLARIGSWLRLGGWLLLVTGNTAWTGTEEDWLGGGSPMWWSHPDRATTRRWLGEAGFEVTDERFVPEGDGGHALFWATLDRGTEEVS